MVHYSLTLIPASWKLPSRLSGPERRPESGASSRCAITLIAGEDGCVGGSSGRSCQPPFAKVSDSDEEPLEYCYAAKMLANNAVQTQRAEPWGN